MGSGEVEAREAGLAGTVGSVAEAGALATASREEVRTGVAASGVAEAVVIKVRYSVVKSVLPIRMKITCKICILPKSGK